MVGDLDAEPYFWGAEISNNRLDAYYSRMDPETTLRNFAADAADGVSFLDSHESRKLGFGQSLTGALETTTGDSQRVVSDFYTIYGIKFGGIHSFQSSDDFIKAVRARIVRDVSVGFYDGREICEICGESVWGWTSCPHFPGQEYPVGEEGGEVVLATSTIYDARLAEVSAVFDGATPGAMITKMENELKAGRLSRDAATRLQTQYRARFPNLRSAVDLSKNWRGEKRGNMDLEKRLKELFPGASEPLAAVRDLLADHEKAQAEIERLRPLADDGQQYRADLIEEALAEGVRANGDDFALETYRGMLEAAPLSQIRQMRDDWARLAKARFPGGRQTQETEQPDDETDPQPVRVVPDSAYQV